MRKLAFPILLSLLCLSVASAATVTWQGDDITNPTFWDDVDNWDTGTVPANGDAVVLTGANDCNINVATAALNSFTMLGYTGHLTGTFNMTITVASGTSAVVFDNGADASNTWSGTLLLNPAAGATINLTAGGWTTWGGITEAGTTTGQVVMLDGTSLAATKIVTLTSGTLVTGTGLTHSWGLFVETGAVARTFTPGNSILNITGAGTAWDCTANTNLTTTANTAAITFSGAGVTAKLGGQTYGGTVAFTGGGATALGTMSNSFGTLTYTGTAAKTNSFTIPSAQTITTALNLNGNSATNRPIIQSGTLGTAVVLTCTGATVAGNNPDLRDITMRPALATGKTIASVATNAGEAVFTTTSAHGLKVGDKITISGFSGGNAGYNGNKTIAVQAAATTFETTDDYVADGTGAWTYDLTNNGANLIGDCGGNAGMTFTPATTQTCTGNSDNASAATWTNHYPLPQDPEVISLTAGQTLTQDMPRLGKDISFGTACNLTLGNAVTSYGSVNLTGMGTFSGAYPWYFESQARSGTNFLTSDGRNFLWTIYIQVVGTTLQLADALTVSGYSVVLFNGTFNDGGFSVTAARFVSSTAYTRVVMKTGDWVLNNLTVANVLDLGVGGVTLAWSDTGTITISDTGANAKTFAGAGQTFNNVSFPSGTGGVIVTGANNFNTVTVAAGGKVTWPANTTNSVNSTVINGTSGSHITFVSSTPGTQYTLADLNGGQNKCSYLDVTDSIGTPANTWYWGTGGSGTRTTGWKLTSGVPPWVMTPRRIQ